MEIRSARALPAIASGILVLWILAPCAAAEAPGLETGYRQLYNLDFPSAHATFDNWKKEHPDDPLGFVSSAAAHLFEEFDRLGILEVELFTDNRRFESIKKPSPDLNAKIAFQQDLAKADALIRSMLSRSSQDGAAQFASILADGLRGDYVALIEKRNYEALKYMKRSRSTAEDLLQHSPEYYDAYLAIGVENYLLSLKPAPIRWFLRIGGAETDRKEGIERLKLTAEKGRYLAPYARLLLAVAALRDKDRETARDLLAGLVSEFPSNRLYRAELDRITRTSKSTAGR